jgi:HSP20 family molecular chaperone IbpA
VNSKAKELFPAIRIDRTLGEAFDRLEEQIRERAYHIFLGRGGFPDDPVADWLDAQQELVSPIEFTVKEQKKNIVVEADLKGFNAAEIEIEVEGDTLKVFGSHTESTEGGNNNGNKKADKTSSTHFYQSMTLPAEVNLDETQARLFKNGKLKITLPRKSPV